MPGVSSTSSPRQGILGAAEFLASKGRNGDTQLTHTTTGETIVPEELLAKNPNLKKDLRLAFENEDIPMEQYVVGSGIMSVNPETGLYEAGWLKKTWKSVRKTVKKAGPVIGAAIGFVVGGPVGASIGAGIGTKTSAQDDYLRNMAIAFGASAGLQGAGAGGAFDAARAARAAGGGFGSGVGAFFNPANWTPMAAGQTGLTGFFQNMGSGAARNLGLGGTQVTSEFLASSGLSAEQANLLQAEMARTGATAVDAALSMGITDPTIISNLGSVAPSMYGPGVISSVKSSYAGLNPLQKFLLQTGFEQTIGVPEGQDGSSGVVIDSPYLTRPLTAGGGNIPTSGGIPGSGISSLPGSAGPTNMTTATINEDPGSPAYASAMNNITKGSTLLDGLSDRFNRAEGINAPALASLVSPFPEFEPPVYAQAGGLGGDLQQQQGKAVFDVSVRNPENERFAFMVLRSNDPDILNKLDDIDKQKFEHGLIMSGEFGLFTDATRGKNYVPSPAFQKIMRANAAQTKIPNMAGGGVVGENRPMFFMGGIHQGGGKVSGPGGEKDDMINAKLSNNEFVMTADAVRGAGNGDINKGANKMYQLMNNFERMA